MHEEQRQRFLEVLLRHLGAAQSVADIAGDTSLRMLGLNSMRAVDLVIDLEEELEFVFPDAEFTDETFSTADSLWRTVQSHRAPAASR
jgi:acyl carrier protein